MKRILAALALVLSLGAASAQAAVSRISQASTSGANPTLTITTPTSNDIIVACQYNNAAATAPTLPTGYTNLTNGTGNTNAIRVSYKVSNGTETTVPSATNTTDVGAIVYRGVSVPTASENSGGSSATMTYSALGFNFGDGNSWAFTCGGNRTAAAATAPTGTTLETNTARLVLSDTEGTTRAWTQQTVAGNTLTGFRTAVVEIRATAPSYATPAEVQWTSASSTMSLTAGTSVYRLLFPEKVQAGNCILLGWQYDNSGGNPTFADDQGDTYKSVLDNVDANSQRHGIAVALNVAANTREVRVSSTSGGTGFKQLQAVELTNCYAIDGSTTNNPAANATITAGSVTPTVSGDYVWQTAIQLVDGHTFTVGSQTNIAWQFVTADDTHASGQVSQGGVYTSVTALNPTLTQNASGKFTSDAVFIFGGARGSAAAGGMRVRAVMHNSFWAVANAGPGYTTSQAVTFPTRSDTNLMVASINGGDPGCGSGCNSITGITDNKSNTWVECGTTGAAPPHYSRVFYAANPTPGTDLMLTLTSSANTIDSTIILYDIVGANTSPCDLAATANNTQGAGTGTITGPSITPTTTGGICIGNIQFVNDTVNAMSGPTGATLDSARDDLEGLDGPENLDQNGGYGHWTNTSATSQTVSWGFVSASDPQQQWISHFACFKAPAVGGGATCVPTMGFFGVSSCGVDTTPHEDKR